MATVQNQMNGFDPSLEDLPAWKKDLILRRRANARNHGGLPSRAGGGGGWSAPHSPTTTNSQFPRLLQGSSQLSLRSVQGSQESLRALCGPNILNISQFNSVSVGGSVGLGPEINLYGVSQRCDSALDDECSSVTSVGSTAMRGPSAMHHKGVTPPGGISTGGWQTKEEELEYGPGIVSRLKNRYMSLALREAKSRASLRKYSSLEDLLDDGGGPQERGRSTQKERPSAGGVSSYKKDFMKRTRSMDSLSFRRTDSSDRVPKSHSSGALRQALVKEDVIIIETPRPSENGGKEPPERPPVSKKVSAPLEEEEMPAPDIVKQVKQIFEPSGKASRGTAAKVAAYKAAQQAKKQVPLSPTIKPPLKAKPLQLQNKKAGGALSPTLENARSSLKQVQPRSLPRSTLSVKATASPGKGGVASPPVHPAVPTGLTPIAASVTAPYVNGDDVYNAPFMAKLNNEPPPKTLPPHQEPSPRPHSPPTVLPPSPTPTHKVSIPSAFKDDPSNTKENQRVLQENKKNAEKSSRAFGEGRPKALPPPPPSGKQAKAPALKLDVSTPTPPEGEASPTPSPVPSVVPNAREAPSVPETAKPTSSSCPPSSGGSVPSHAKTFDSGSSPVSSPSVLEVVRAAEAKTPLSSSFTDSPSSLAGFKSPSKGKESSSSRWHQQDNSTLVFNFSKRTETPDYIENDGVDLSKKFSHKHEPGYVIMPGYDGKTDSSTDDPDADDDDVTDAQHRGVGLPAPPPCNVTFEGEGVIINGRSNLQRQPRAKKIEVTFDMPSTSTFEYPSEALLTLEFDAQDRRGGGGGAGAGAGAPQPIPPYSSSSVPAVPTKSGGPSNSTGGLASYTPSKLQLSDTFELGVSRSTAPYHPPTPPKGRAPLEGDLLLLQDHVRPADETETVTWSAESAPDMLF